MKKIEEIVEGFLAYLSSSKQLDLLPQIISQLSLRVKEEEETAYVTSAIPLTSEEEDKILKFLKQKFGKGFKIKVQVDPKIIGGLTIRIGDQLIDQSLGGRLKTLVRNLEG